MKVERLEDGKMERLKDWLAGRLVELPSGQQKLRKKRKEVTGIQE